MANDLYNYVIKSPVDSVIRWTESNGTMHVLALPIAAGGSFNRNPELQRLTKANCQGLRVTAKRVEIGEDPVATLEFGATSLDLIALRQNRRWESVASAAGYYGRSDYDVPVDGLVAAQTTDYLGYNITANAVSKAAYIGPDGRSIDLVQDTDYASFNPSSVGNELKFAVGAAGAMKFGSGLWGKSVSFSIPITYTNFTQLGNLPYTNLSLKVRVALVNLQVVEWVYDSVSVNPEGDTSFAAAETFSMPFYVEGSYTLRNYNKLNPC